MPKWLKKKKKEQANVANDGDETDSIGTEKCLTINGYDLLDYPSRCEALNQSVHTSMQDIACTAHTMLCSIPIIDSGASTHIFADRTLFSSYNTT